MVDAQFVQLCYRAILEREPESAAVVDEKARTAPSPEALIAEFLNCPEFEALRLNRSTGPFFDDSAKRIDVQVTADQREALFRRVQEQWKTLGETEPYWSVLTHGEYLQANLDDRVLAGFYETGAGHAALIDRCGERTGARIGRGVCLELGCGVGRVTKHLAGRFEKVIAVDISAGNLRQGQAMAEREGLSNIEFRLLASLDELSGLGDADFFYSVIALQHNPPPIQYIMIDEIVKKLRPGGGFFFQTQTFHKDYDFSIDRYLASPLGVMDMHSLPMHQIMRLLADNGCSVLEVMEDFWTGRFGSHSVFGLCRPA